MITYYNLTKHQVLLYFILLPTVSFTIFHFLECLKEENTFFIVSPKDIVIARPRDKDDHVMWLLEHDKYEVSVMKIINILSL